MRITLRLLSITIDTARPAPTVPLEDQRDVALDSLVERAEPQPIGFRANLPGEEDRRG